MQVSGITVCAVTTAGPGTLPDITVRCFSQHMWRSCSDLSDGYQQDEGTAGV
jgi:hypothetical protein